MTRPIINKALIFISLLFSFSEIIRAQWTEKDSIWLQEVVSGKRKIKLNPEFEKQIKSGTLISIDEKKQLYIKPPIKDLISKDFSEFLLSTDMIDDTTTNAHKSKAIMYNSTAILKYNTLPSFYISPKERQRLRNSLPSATTFNAENMLRYLFWKEHRAKMRNKKKARAWKHYNLE